MKTTKEMIEVMQAYLRGEEIEYRFGYKDWLECRVPIWNWNSIEYRVKKNKKQKIRQRQSICRSRRWMNFWQRKESTEP